MNSAETKIRYLQLELKSSQEENQELRQLVQLNKEVIKIQKECYYHTGLRMEGEVIRSEGNSDRGFQSLLHQIYEENVQIYKLNEMIAKQRDEARSKALVYEQIYEDSVSKAQELQLENQLCILEFQKKADEKDRQIMRLSDQLQDFQSRKKIKDRIIVKPTEEIIEMLQYVEQMKVLIGQFIKENRHLKQERNEQLVLIDLLKQNQNQNDNFLASPHYSDNEDNVYPQKQASNSKQQQYAPDDSSFAETLPIKVLTNQKASAMPIPKLDLAKAQKIQKYNIEKQDQIEEQEEIEVKTIKLQQQSKGILMKSQTPSNSSAMGQFNGPNKIFIQMTTLQENNKVLTKELALCRQRLQDEMLLAKQLDDQVDECTRKLAELEHTNELLIHSCTRYEQRWSKIFQQFQHYQEFYFANGGDSLTNKNTSPRLHTNMNQAVTLTSHRANYSNQVIDMAYGLYHDHKIESRMRNIESLTATKKRSLSMQVIQITQ